MNATIIRIDGTEIEIRSIQTYRDIAIALRTRTPPDELDFEIIQGEDGKEVVVYDEHGDETNIHATRALPDIARSLGGQIAGDILVMSYQDFQRLRR